MSTSISLRIQIIDAMNDHAKAQGWADRTFEFNRDMFEQAIMPILDKAIEGGDLLLTRNMAKRIPVPEAILGWVRGMQAFAASVKMQEATVSKRDLLRMVYSLGESATQALKDVEGKDQPTPN